MKLTFFWKFDITHIREIDPPLDGEWGAVGEDGTFSGRRFRSCFERERKLFELINQFRLRISPSQAGELDHGLIGFAKEKKLFEKNILNALKA